MLLRDKDRANLIQIFSTIEIPIEVLGYGSRINGTAHDGSDLGLVIRSLNGEKLPIELLMTIKKNIQESNIPILVDVFDWERLPESFQDNILQQHELLFSNLEMMTNEQHVSYKKKDNSK